MCALDEWTVEEVLALARRSAPYSTLTRPVLESVLDMLAGKYPSEDFAELRARITWDRLSDTLTGRRGAQRLAVTSGGTIPDRGLYAVFLATGEGPGRRVGELDEEMVYESRVGDLFTLGTSTWRIEDITHDRVLVTPAPGLPGRLPFWKGDSLGRPAELGRAVGAFVREVEALSPAAARERVMAAGLDDWAADNLLTYLREQREATGHVPDDRTIVVERFRDELGDWRIAVHSPFGAQVHAPWALALSARMRDRFGVDVQAMHGDDGIVLRLPDLEWDDVDGLDRRGVGRELLDLVTLDPDDVQGPGHRGDRRVGPLRQPVPRVRRPGAAAAPPPPRPPAAAVAAAPAGLPAARGRQPLPDLPDRPRGRPRVRPGRLRRARARRPHARRRRPVGHRRRRRVEHAVAVRQVAALRLRRPVPLRGRHPPRRAPRRRPRPRPLAPRRAARRLRGAGPARPARRRAGRPHRGRAPAAHPRAGGPRRRRRPRPAAGARAAAGRRRAPALPRGRHRQPTSRPGSPRWPRPGRSSPSGWPARTAGPRSRTPPGCATRSAPPCPPGSPRPSSTRSRTPSATSSRATPAPTCRSTRARWPAPTASASRSPRARSPGSRRRDGSSRASCCPPGAAPPSSATPRCSGCCGAARWPRCGPRSSRSRPTPSAASSPSGRASAGGCAGATACSARSSS